MDRPVSRKTRIPFVLLRGMSFLFERTGHRFSLALGAKIGDLFRIFLPSKVRRVRLNLERAYPDLRGTKALRRTEAEVFRHFGRMGAEFFRFPVLDEGWVRDHVLIENLSIVKDCLEEGRGVLAFIAHFGNWELISKRLALELDVPCHVVTRQIRDPKIDLFIRERRLRYGKALSIPAEAGGIRAILRALARNEIVVLAVDQSAGPPEGIPVPFFGRLAGTHTGAARIALRQNLPLLPAFICRLPDGRHRVRFGPLLEFPSGASLSDPEKIAQMTWRMTGVAEERIREHPEQWIWMHNRWKEFSC
ncbi:MAG: lysophospholipid acyltransferase family protein [Leptospirillia bacterium]